MATEEIKPTCSQQISRNTKFAFNYFDPKSEEWKYYHQRFELEIKLAGLESGSDTIRDLLLKWLGPEVYKITADNFEPRTLLEVPYNEIVDFLTSYFQPTAHFLSERMNFMNIHRKPNQTIKQYTNELKSAAQTCKFGSNLDERMRDQFLLGLKNPPMQEELFRLFPNTDSKFVDIEKQAILIENAQNQRNIFELQNSSDINKVQKKISPPNRSEIKQSSTIPNKNKEYVKTSNKCLRCGNRLHYGEKCPAEKSRCNACNTIGHWSTMCIKSGNFTLPTKNKKRVNKIDSSDTDEEEKGTDEGYIHKVKQNEHGRYMVDVYLNGRKISMEYDTAASRSLIGKQVWSKIGKPTLSKTVSLTAYPNFDIPMLGESTVTVKIGNITKEHTIAVTRDDGTPLLGKDLITSFGLQPQCKLVSYTINNISTEANGTPNSSHNEGNNAKAVQKKYFNDLAEKTTSDIIGKFPEVFSESAGQVTNFEVKLFLDENTKPVINKPRPVPFALRNAADKEIERLLDHKIIERIDPTDTVIGFASPVVYVAKPNGSVRLCGDFRSLNKHLQPQPHPIPTFEEVVSKLNGFNTFSVIDLKDAYLQLPVHPDSQKYLVIATHKGYFKYKRMPFGISPASQIFQKYIDTLLSDIEGVTWFIDDICTGGKTEKEHLARLEQIFTRFRQAGLKTQRQKLHLMCDEIRFLGHTIDKNGIHPTSERIDAIKGQPTPRNVSELRSFLGSINYYSRFIPKLQLKCAPLHRLLKKGVKWNWNCKDTALYEELKDILSSDKTLVHYNPDLPLILSTDASDLGVAAILMHRCKDGIDRPIAAASRTLTPNEKGYSIIDKEALAIIFGVNKFYQFIYGRHFTLLCDHKPLERIFGQKNDLPKFAASRLTRWCITLSAFDYDIKYIPGTSNAAADALSRLPLPTTEISDFERQDVSIICQILNTTLDELPITRHNLKKHTQRDEETRTVIAFVERGWPEKRKISENFLPFFEKRFEISFEDNILMWQNRIIIPKTLRSQVLDLLHEGHYGVVAMKSFARMSVWWPNIDGDIERKVKLCIACQKHRKQEPETPLNLWNIPSGPWERVHLDFLGPFEGKMWLIVIDAYSRWLNVFPMTQTTTDKVVQNLRSLFSQYGICRKLVTDNGPQFTSKEFKSFTKLNNIIHIRSSPYHSRTNGMAERVIQTFQTHYLAAKDDFVNQTQRLQSVLFAYRNRVHSSTSRTPAEMFLGRRLNTVLDLLKPSVTSNMDTSQYKQKSYHDLHAKERDFLSNQPVWVKRSSKPESKWEPASITQKTAPLSYRININGKTFREHADHIRPRLEHNRNNNTIQPTEDLDEEPECQNHHQLSGNTSSNENNTGDKGRYNLRSRRNICEPKQILRDQFIYYG